MTKLINELFPVTSAVTSGGGAYWITTQISHLPDEYAMWFAVITGVIMFRGTENE